jgi:hypothetical protein
MAVDSATAASPQYIDFNAGNPDAVQNEVNDFTQNGGVVDQHTKDVSNKYADQNFQNANNMEQYGNQYDSSAVANITQGDRIMNNPILNSDPTAASEGYDPTAQANGYYAQGQADAKTGSMYHNYSDQYLGVSNNINKNILDKETNTSAQLAANQPENMPDNLQQQEQTQVSYANGDDNYLQLGSGANINNVNADIDKYQAGAENGNYTTTDYENQAFTKNQKLFVNASDTSGQYAEAFRDQGQKLYAQAEAIIADPASTADLPEGVDPLAYANELIAQGDQSIATKDYYLDMQGKYEGAATNLGETTGVSTEDIRTSQTNESQTDSSTAA